MPIQESIIKLNGTMGDLTFYKTEDGFLARRKGGVTAERMRTDPRFERTRENQQEFARAGKAVRLIRKVLRSHLLQVADKRMTGRLMQVLNLVVQADKVSTRGQRNVIDGEIELLTGFEFNVNGILTQTFHAPYTTVIDRATGNLSVSIPAFIPSEMVTYPQGATHCRFFAVGALINFEDGRSVITMSESPEVLKGNQEQAAIQLAQAVTPASTDPLLLLLGIRFFQEVNGRFYPLRNGAHNALGVVLVDGGV
ncbi:MAG TPA: hypothetical protein VGK59_18415 [Ohtaekwangia sp.]